MYFFVCNHVNLLSRANRICTILRVCSLQDHAGAAAQVERRAGEAQLRGQDAAVPGRGRDRGVLRRVGCHG